MLLNEQVDIFSFETYSNFKKILAEKINQINQEKEIELKGMIKLGEDKDIFLEYLLFINYKKLIYINTDSNIFNNNSIFLEELKKYKIYEDKSFFNDKLLKMIVHLYLYLIINLEKEINNITQNNKDDEIINNEIKLINEYYYLVYRILFLISKLYLENIYNLKNLLLFLDILEFFIDGNNIINDKFTKVKNIIFFELLFNLYGKILYIFLKINNNKEDILLFINYLTKNLDNYKIKSGFNSSILANNKIIQNLILVLLNNINFSKILHIDIYNLCNISIIDSFTNIYQNNISNSNFFEILINQNKESFTNLSNFLKNKENIINDIYKHNFYITLLNNIFKKEKILANKNTLNNKFNPPKNSFIYNGYDSKMTFKLNKIQLDNSILFFSFQLSNDINNKNYNLPLLIFENSLTNNILFKLYIKHTINNESNKPYNKLYISQEKNRDILLDKIEDISPNNNYYIALIFKKKLDIYINSVNNQKESIYQEIVDINNITELQINLKIGHNDNQKEFFKGFIGSFFLIKNITLTKDSKYSDIIPKILQLKDFYYYFPYFYSKTTNYQFENIISYYQINDSNYFKNIKIYLQKYIKEFECYLYITPEIIDLYYSLKDKNIPFIYLPEIPDICEYQQCFVILDMNISLTNIETINEKFLTNNGFDYICLIYEYFYQFSNLYLLNKKEFNNDSKEPKIKKIIINTISKTILLLENYNKCKYIIKFECSLKKMFKNLYECIKSLNKICNILSEDIISNLYELVFSFIVNAIMNNEKNILNEKDLQNKVLPFCNGLIDILFDIELYKNYDENNSIEILFLFVSSFLTNYIKNINEKIFPFKPDFFWKIINFTQILEKYFTKDYKNANKTISSFFNLLENYFIAIKNQKYSLSYFKTLLQYCLGNYQNNLIITYNFLCFIHEMLWNGYTLEDIDILLLLKYCNKYYDENKDNSEKLNDKIITELFSIISCILVDLIFNKDSNLIIDEVNKNLYIFSNNQIILLRITNEILKIIEGQIKNDYSVCHNKDQNNVQIKCYKDNISNYMTFYWNIFYFIINLLKNLISVKEYNNSEEENVEKKKICEIKNNINLYRIFSLLVNIEEILRHIKNKNFKNIHCTCCLINFLKFYHYIIFNEKNILHFFDNAFIDNLLQIINLCSKIYYLINCSRLFKVIIDGCEYNKTIVEIIFEIYIQFFLNNNNGDYSRYKDLLSSHSMFYDIEFEKEKKYTIFFVNDFFRYMLNQNEISEENKNIVTKYKVLLKYNKYAFEVEENFEKNFTTFFFLIFFNYKKLLNKIKENPLINELKKIINVLYLNILEDHVNLKLVDKKFFFKTNSSFYQYNELIKLIKNKFIPKKKNYLEEINKFLENNSQQIAEKINKGNISLSFDNDKKENEKDKKEKKVINNINEKKDLKEIIDTNKNIEENIKKEMNKKINIDYISIPENINKINYFNKYDKFFLKNIKNEIMNNIFSLYYKDIFFYNKAFCRMRDYFVNTFSSVFEEYTSYTVLWICSSFLSIFIINITKSPSFIIL